MARHSAPKNGPSRVRFIILEAELSDGDLSQITHAIQNALAPASKTPLRLAALSKSQSKIIEADTEDEDESDGVETEEGLDLEASKTNARPRGQRKSRSPKVLDLDLKADVSLATFAQSKKTDTDVARNLVIAAWFKQHRNLNEVTVDHIYTGYRAMGWPTGIPDFGKPLKNLKQRQFFDGKDGNYAINHLGIARVDQPDG